MRSVAPYGYWPKPRRCVRRPWAAAMQQDHVGMLGVDLVEPIPDHVMIVEVEAAGEGDLWPCRGQHFGLGTALRCEEVTAIDHRRGDGAMVDHRPRARPPG